MTNKRIVKAHLSSDKKQSRIYFDLNVIMFVTLDTLI